MFALIESCPEQRPGFGWTGKVISLGIHAFVISAALAFTQNVHANDDTPSPPTPMIWDVAPRAVKASPPAAPDNPAAPVTRVARLPIVAPVAVPVDLPPPVPASNYLPAGNPPINPVTPGGTAGALLIGSGEPRDVHLVDQLPELVGHPELRYPEALRRAGIEGRVMVETVLDTLGRAEVVATRVVTGVHQMFDDEAVRVVLGSRYQPARVDGRAVRVRVQVPVTFTIRQ